MSDLKVLNGTVERSDWGTAYSALKPAFHLDRVKDLRETGRCVPAQIQLILSDKCNQDCSFCAYRMSGYTSNQRFPDEDGNHNPNRMIPKAKALEILMDAHRLGCKAVQFTGGGEPTVHPQHLEVFAYALKIGMQCALVTNGSVLRSGWDDLFPQFSWIRVSLDAGTAETYASIRGVSPKTFDKVVSNIKRLVDTCGERVGLSFVVTRENIGEMRQAYQVARECGVSSIRYTAVFTPMMADYYRGVEIPELVGMPDDGPTVIDMVNRRLDNMDEGAPDYPICGYQHFNVYIGGDLNVYRCCNTAYNDLGLLGSIKDRSFREFWEDDETSEKYVGFDARACAHCAFHPQNRTINYLLTGDRHVEFV